MDNGGGFNYSSTVLWVLLQESVMTRSILLRWGAIGLVFGLTALGVAYWLANVVIWPLVNLAASDLWIFNPDKEQRAG